MVDGRWSMVDGRWSIKWSINQAARARPTGIYRDFTWILPCLTVSYRDPPKPNPSSWTTSVPLYRRQKKAPPNQGQRAGKTHPPSHCERQFRFGPTSSIWLLSERFWFQSLWALPRRTWHALLETRQGLGSIAKWTTSFGLHGSSQLVHFLW